ncbi:Hypothetical predicted protein [Lecanosticta acicola]|uniref:Uncharacterized protein n=1 Tax=Lecanosticta acicola TaxID=111012 RepID=A0AAI9EDI7_9PEZI|nr:Hypothetical predicted protein [Lecanosticta acicola]
MSNISLNSSTRIIQRQKSMVEVEQEEERTLVNDFLISLVEPRPSIGPACGSIEAVLDGSA